ncbi:hypothetical protein F4824DRAFT_507272 [Ustulina deusta]|nr:hypothetical protein F4824DRAFT_507272 [Ustulina deusta]
MASQAGLRELRDLNGERDSTPADENYSENLEKHRKARPSVDIKLAQNYRERQDLPPVGQGADPEHRRGPEDIPSPDLEYAEIVLDERLKIDLQTTTRSRRAEEETKAEDGWQPRDYVTGRMLSEHGRSCLRCTEKELRCTLNFVGKETEPQCAACRRSKAAYCVRFHPLGENSRGIPFHGPLWKNPNFVAGGPADGTAVRLPGEQLEDILREFYDERPGYVMGNYVAAGDVRNYALPPFNGADLSPADRPGDYETMDWKDVLPDWKNRSLSRPHQTEEKNGWDEREKRKKRLAIARELSLLPPNPTGEEVDWRKMARMQAGSSGDAYADEISFLRVLRRYRPRERNLSDVG